MEYVLVELKDVNGNDVDRGVLIDNQRSGRTNSVLMVQGVHHKVQLDNPNGYTPPFQKVEVRNTLSNMPHVVSFTLTAA